jgi:hypothetical protein
MGKRPVNATTINTVIKNDYEVEYKRVKLKATTPEYAAVRREHGKVERKLGELARHHGNRLARYRGIVKTLVQSLLRALVVYVKRIVRFPTQGGRKPQTPWRHKSR